MVFIIRALLQHDTFSHFYLNGIIRWYNVINQHISGISGNHVLLKPGPDNTGKKNLISLSLPDIRIPKIFVPTP